MTDAVVETAFGRMMRDWRATRRLSQLELALRADVSARHLSYVETGKAQPSRDLVEQLAEALEMPLRHRNSLLLAAGYAPQYRESELAAPEMALIRRAIDVTLEGHEPFPAFTTNRYWDVLQANQGMIRLLGAVRPGGPGHDNIVRQVFDPEAMRSFIDNWDEVADDLIRYLNHEAARNPSDQRIRGLLDEALAWSGERPRWRRAETPAPLPVMTTVFRVGERRLTFFSTVTQFGGASNATVEDLRIETMHPVDAETRAFCVTLSNAS
ncbi:MAG: helix-turn-helix domain-containing protein [Brevundimonas sp.]